MNRKLYLAYGSNLSEAQMAERCPDAVIVGKTDIQNYQLSFRKSRTGYYATIDVMEGSSVPAAVWAISENDEATLDRREGFPEQYQKAELEIELFNLEDGTLKGVEKAMVYILPESRELGAPTDVYYDKLDKGYERFGFNKDILIDAVKRSSNSENMEEE